MGKVHTHKKKKKKKERERELSYGTLDTSRESKI